MIKCPSYYKHPNQAQSRQTRRTKSWSKNSYFKYTLKAETRQVYKSDNGLPDVHSAGLHPIQTNPFHATEQIKATTTINKE